MGSLYKRTLSLSSLLLLLLTPDQYQDMKAYFRKLLEKKYHAKKSHANKHNENSQALAFQVCVAFLYHPFNFS